ncbi:MAG: PstS family phosphate ABC transporter substrate-binding protein, partial [Halovenus sp.]
DGRVAGRGASRRLDGRGSDGRGDGSRDDCRGDGSGDGSGDDGSGDDGGEMELSGTLRVSGSSTVFPVSQAVGRQFVQMHPEVEFNLSKDGSGGGFKNVFIPGDSDINNASRPIKDSELQDCRDNGIDPIEFQVAQDALTVVVNNNADWVDSMDVSTIGEIWSPETKPETWADVNSDWPDEPFDLYGAATTSGTFDYFTETVVGEEDSIREDYEGTERDDTIAQGVASNEAAFGYLPFAYYVNNPDSVKALAISQGGGEAVAPSLEAAQSGEYPLARPLFFYANDNKLAEKPVVQEFCRFMIEQSGEDFIANDIGYVPSSDDRVQNNLDKLNQNI